MNSISNIIPSMQKLFSLGGDDSQLKSGGKKRKVHKRKGGVQGYTQLGRGDVNEEIIGGAKKRKGGVQGYTQLGRGDVNEEVIGGSGRGAPMKIEKKFRATERKSQRVIKKKLEKAMDKYDDMLSALGGIEKEVKKDIALVKKQKEKQYKQSVDELTLAFSGAKF